MGERVVVVATHSGTGRGSGVPVSLETSYLYSLGNDMIWRMRSGATVTPPSTPPGCRSSAWTRTGRDSRGYEAVGTAETSSKIGEVPRIRLRGASRPQHTASQNLTFTTVVERIGGRSARRRARYQGRRRRGTSLGGDSLQALRPPRYSSSLSVPAPPRGLLPATTVRSKRAASSPARAPTATSKCGMSAVPRRRRSRGRCLSSSAARGLKSATPRSVSSSVGTRTTATGTAL